MVFSTCVRVKVEVAQTSHYIFSLYNLIPIEQLITKCCIISGQLLINNEFKAVHVGAVRSKQGSTDFHWANSKFPFPPYLWCNGEPSDTTGDEDTAVVYLNGTLCFDDVYPSYKTAYICEIAC